jgi:cation diffusion facilitator family transporter
MKGEKMHTKTLDNWQHSHSFDQDQVNSAEKYTVLVMLITAVTMFAEIITGILFGSMALLADGLHMGSHSLALGISVFAYYFTRKYAHDERFSFGTGKVSSLAGFSSALLLVIFALIMAWESIDRFIHPVVIQFNQAIFVAFIGLIVNVVSMFILNRSGHDEPDHAIPHHPDHNLRSAYLHVFADALTSLIAILALLAGKYWGLIWMDPLMGIMGAMMIIHWAYDLIRETILVLLDRQVSQDHLDSIKSMIEKNTTDRVADLHVWTIGSHMYAMNMTVVSDRPQSPDYYKNILPGELKLVHITIEVQRCERD